MAGVACTLVLGSLLGGVLTAGVSTSPLISPVDDDSMERESFLNNGPVTGVAKSPRALGMGGKKHGEVEFVLHSRRKPDGEKFVDRSRSVYSAFNPRLPTKIVIHGWKGNGGQWYSAQLKDALLKKGDMNVIVVDWTKHGSHANYVAASNSVSYVAGVVADFIDRLAREHGCPPERVHLLGHSLGAHVSGVAGARITTGKLDRITGFDPAGVLYKDSTKDRLRPESASFVDVVHSCVNILGHSMTMGHVDFFPNGGKAPQPGCGTDLTGVCSHSRSYEYYIESLSNPVGFPGAQCDNWDAFLKKNGCDFSRINYVGEQVNRRKPGKFFLSTNDKPSFAGGITWH